MCVCVCERECVCVFVIKSTPCSPTHFKLDTPNYVVWVCDVCVISVCVCVKERPSTYVSVIYVFVCVCIKEWVRSIHLSVSVSEWDGESIYVSFMYVCKKKREWVCRCNLSVCVRKREWVFRCNLSVCVCVCVAVCVCVCVCERLCAGALLSITRYKHIRTKTPLLRVWTKCFIAPHPTTTPKPTI